MSQERFWVLLSRKLAREANAQDLLELEQLIQGNPEWQFAVQSIEDIWAIRAEPDELKAETAFACHIQRMNEKNIGYVEPEAEEEAIQMKGRGKKKWFFAAAAMLVAIASWFGIKEISGKSSGSKFARQVNEITTHPGSKTRIELPDGSIVWLNSGSKLTYNGDFNKETREVTLTGEGYFDVAKNKEKPFVIHTSTINVKVLGTVFNLRAYPQDKKTETSLIHGSVEVTIRNRPNNKIILSPNEKLIVENGASFLEKRKEKAANAEKDPVENIISVNRITYSPVDSTIAETEWINNRLVFRDESFEDLAVKMERWYNIKIEINDQRLREYRLSGTFETETITQALDALKISLPFRYEQDGNKILVHR
jgi:ferric-dicitrate binding protein FerR (iron transport regulator)